MNFDLPRPCKNCPFLKGQRYLTPARVHEIITSITDLQQSFSCHKTNTPGEDEEGFGIMIETDDSQHCAGAMIFLERMDRPNQMMRVMERLGAYDRRKLDMSSPVYEDEDEMIAGHGG